MSNSISESIGSINDKIDTMHTSIEAKIDSLQQDFDNLDTQVNSINDTVNGLSSDVSDIKTAMQDMVVNIENDPETGNFIVYHYDGTVVRSKVVDSISTDDIEFLIMREQKILKKKLLKISWECKLHSHFSPIHAC